MLILTYKKKKNYVTKFVRVCLSSLILRMRSSCSRMVKIIVEIMKRIDMESIESSSDLMRIYIYFSIKALQLPFPFFEYFKFV